MIDLAEFLWGFSIISLLLHFFKMIRKATSMAVSSNSPPSSSSSPSFAWLGFRSPILASKGLIFATMNYPKENTTKELNPIDNSSSTLPVPISEGPVLKSVENMPENLCSEGDPEENLQNFVPKRVSFTTEESFCDNSKVVGQDVLNSLAKGKIGEVKLSGKVRKRPAMIVIPESDRGLDFSEESGDSGEGDFEVEGRSYFLASKRGRRKVMEDGYGVITDISGDSKQAFFGVFDGHGGSAAVKHVAEHLGKNIITALKEIEKGEDQLEKAIKTGYLTTDKDFLIQDLSSGACAATVLLKDGELHVANVGDCRVVLSRKGVANALTIDHRVERKDERIRIENSGGYVNCFNGVWRVQGSLAVSRAIGDLHLKQWVISEPEINKIQLTTDCEFFIMASDGLWDKVSNQEAVNVVLKHKNSIESCKKLVDISCSRGNNDDITVMVVDLQKFTQVSG
ncbi:putative protein phosphatase 2C 2 [Tasmannia lanceolata]|uniref:putative protein phosphatase 2C 2 n=1 Tax=Tasmannia lanceolata TaxID=3420 RepID=UPI0040633C64